MLIVSKFKDYYDAIQRHGIDKSIVYERRIKRIGVHEGEHSIMRVQLHSNEKQLDGIISSDMKGMQNFWAPFDSVRFWSAGSTWGRFTCNIQEFVVGFCGVIQPGIQVLYGTKGPYANALDILTEKTALVYSVQELDKLVNSFPKAAQTAYYVKKKSKKKKTKSDPLGKIHNFEHTEIAQYFKVHSPQKDDTLFQEYKTPIIILKKLDVAEYGRTTALVINGSLAEVGYVKIVDPYLAFQQIAQYISGVLGVGEPELLEISDEDMRDKKGFFDMSFKKDPGVKKPRRRGK